MIGLEADQHARRREQQGQRHGARDQRHGNAELDRHDTVERAAEKHEGDADRQLEERQADQPAERQIGRRHIRERHEDAQETRHPRLAGHRPVVCRNSRHRAASSMAWLL